MAEIIPPWQRPDLFAEKPSDEPYGYMDDDRPVACSQEDLMEALEPGSGRSFDFAWTPEVERISPVAMIPSFSEPLQRRAKASLWLGTISSLFLMLFHGWLYSGADTPQQKQQVLLLLMILGVLPLVSYVWQLRQLRRQRSEPDEAQVAALRYATWIGAQRRPVVWLLTGVIVAVAGAQIGAGFSHSIEVGSLNKSALSWAELHRFFTAPLMHGNANHLIFNSLALFFLGTAIEALLGSAGLGLLFFVSCLGGAACSYLLNSQSSVGASGGIMGLIGALLVLGFRFHHILPPSFIKRVVFSVVVTAVLGILAWDVIDNAAHAGGLITGILMSWLLVRNQAQLPIQPTQLAQWGGGISLFFVVISAAWAFLVFFRA